MGIIGFFFPPCPPTLSYQSRKFKFFGSLVLSPVWSLALRRLTPFPSSDGDAADTGSLGF